MRRRSPTSSSPAPAASRLPAERLNEARLKLAGQGLTDNDSFAAMEKDSGFGVSQFMENARYQHALEIGAGAHDREPAARRRRAGHLADAAPVRVRPRPATASASVFVQLKPGPTLEQEQVQAIVNLVASSVPDLISRCGHRGRPAGAAPVRAQGHDPYAMDEREYAHRPSHGDRLRATHRGAPHAPRGARPGARAGRRRARTSGSASRPTSNTLPTARSSAASSCRSRARGSAASGGVPGSLSNEPPRPA